MKTIIEELDQEGINLQETRLNLKHQGYEDYYGNWVRLILEEAIWKRQHEITMQYLKERKLI